MQRLVNRKDSLPSKYVAHGYNRYHAGKLVGGAAAAAPSRSMAPLLLSELHIARPARPDTYTVFMAAPGAVDGDLHHHVDPLTKVLRVSNAEEPVESAAVTYLVDEPWGVPVYAHPSFDAPVVAFRRRGERLRGYTPVHNWVCLMLDEGFIFAGTHHRQCSKSPLQVLEAIHDGADANVAGTALPLGADESSSSQGFARYLLLPPDADADAVSARLDRRAGLFVVEVGRLGVVPLPPRRAAAAPLEWKVVARG